MLFSWRPSLEGFHRRIESIRSRPRRPLMSLSKARMRWHILVRSRRAAATAGRSRYTDRFLYEFRILYQKRSVLKLESAPVNTARLVEKGATLSAVKNANY